MSYKLIIPKMAKFNYQNKINVYKNKFTTNRPQLSLTDSLAQIKAMKSTNMSRTIPDLELCIYIEN
jgi:hypothetical protein